MSKCCCGNFRHRKKHSYFGCFSLIVEKQIHVMCTKQATFLSKISKCGHEVIAQLKTLKQCKPYQKPNRDLEDHLGLLSPCIQYYICSSNFSIWFINNGTLYWRFIFINYPVNISTVTVMFLLLSILICQQKQCPNDSPHERKITFCNTATKCEEQTSKKIDALNIESDADFAPREHQRVIVEGLDEVKDLAPPEELPLSYNNEDVKRELFRLTTFRNFPHNRVECSKLARAGFFYTGVEDRVQCFVCLNVISATAAYNPFDPEMHRSTCGFMGIGHGFGNISLDEDPLEPNRRNHQSDSYSNRSTANVFHQVDRTDEFTFDIRERPYQSAQPSVAGTGYPYVTPPLPLTIHEQPSHSEFRTPDSSSIEHQALLRRLNLCSESDRFETFRSWPTQPQKPSPRSLARTGFYYLGDFDRTQCFSCQMILRDWYGTDSPQDIHLRRNPDCPMALGREQRNIPDLSATSEPLTPSTFANYDLTEEEKRELLISFPCLHPVSPDMRNVEYRVMSFSFWNYTHASIEDIAEAGFFHLGTSDRTKCFYCNGGLQNWCYYDNPWEEHAKWYPTCEYLLQCKGLDYVHAVTARYPNITRPVLPNSTRTTLPQNRSTSQETNQETQSASASSEVTPPTTQRSTSSILDEAMQSEVAKTVIGMGYEESIVRQLNQRLIEIEGEAFSTSASLLAAVMEFEENNLMETEQEQEDNTSTLIALSSPLDAGESFEVAMNQFSVLKSLGRYPHPSSVASLPLHLSGSVVGPAPRFSLLDANPTATSSIPNMPSSSRSLRVENQLTLQPQFEQVTEERLCRICFEREANVLFMPCSHMCCCAQCAPSLRQCPICCEKIQKSIRTYAVRSAPLPTASREIRSE